MSEDNFLDSLKTESVAEDSFHVHEITGTNLQLTEIYFEASGAFRVEVLINGEAIFVGFIGWRDGAHVGRKYIKFKKTLTRGQKAKVILTNRDGYAQDMYSTIKGEWL